MIDVDAPEIRRRVDSAIAKAGGAGRLIGFEAVEIQRFVTASSRPIAIQGASAALTSFDQGVARHTDTIFAGGGRGLMLVPENVGAERIAELKSEFRRLTHGSPLSVVDVPFDASNQAGSLRCYSRARPRCVDPDTEIARKGCNGAAVRPGSTTGSGAKERCGIDTEAPLEAPAR